MDGKRAEARCGWVGCASAHLVFLAGGFQPPAFGDGSLGGQAAVAQGIPLIRVDAGCLDALARAELSEEAKARIVKTVQQGYTVDELQARYQKALRDAKTYMGRTLPTLPRP